MSREFGSSGMPCSITDGPESEDDSHFHEPQEREYDKYQDSEDYADLNATLKNIGRLHSVTTEIEKLTQGLRNSLIGKPQA